MTEKNEDNKPAGAAHESSNRAAVGRLFWAKKVLRYVGYRIIRWAGELTAIVFGLGFIWCYMMSTLLAQKSIDLSALEPNIALWFSQVFDGRSAEIDSMMLKWHPSNNTLTFDMSDIVVRDKYRIKTNNIENLQTVMNFEAAMRGRVQLQELNITGGAVTWRRDQSGQVVTGVGTPETVGKFATLPQGRDVSEGETDTPARRSFSIGDLEGVSVSGTSIYVVDALNGIDLKLEDTDLRLTRDAQQFFLEASAMLSQQGDGSVIQGRALFSPDYEDFDLVIAVKNLNPSLAAPKGGQMAQARRLDAPINMNLQIVSGRNTGLSQVDVDFDVGAGNLYVDGQPMPIESFSIVAAYDPAAEILNLSDVDLKSEKYSFAGSGQLTNIGRPAVGFLRQPAGFKADLVDVYLDFSHIFDAPFGFDSLNLSGGYDPGNQSLVFNDLRLAFPDFAIQTRLELGRDQTGELQAIAGKGKLIGTMNPDQLMSVWPTKFSLGARRWIDRAILKAVIDDLEFDFSIPKSALAGGPIDRDDLTLSFGVKEGDVRYISTMTPFANASGRGLLRGNSFEFDVESGQIGNIEVQRGRIDIPRLNPKGGDLIIDFEGRGQVPDMVSLIDQKPFEFPARFGVKPDDFSGTGDVKVKITRPLLENFDKDRISYAISGEFKDVKTPFTFGPNKLEKGKLSLSADKTGMRISGPASLGPWAANLEYEQPFTGGAAGAKSRIFGVMNRETLDGFGIGLRKYFGGQLFLDINAAGNGINIADANFTADLKDAELRIGETWSKEKGVAAGLSGIVSRSAEGGFSAKNMKMDAPGLSLAGKVAFAKDMRLLEFELSEANVEGVIDAQIRVKPDANLSAFDVDVDGKFLDVSPFVSAAVAAPTKSGISLPMNLAATLERLALSNTLILQDAVLEVTHNGMGTERGKIKGATLEGPFLATIKSNRDQGGRTLSVDIPNASRALSSILKVNSIKGGRLQLESQIPAIGEEGPVQGLLEVEDFVLVNAPVFAQMLSLASLKGLADAMGGSGLNFNELELPFAYDKGEFSVREGRASGPALGLTGSGDVDIGKRTIDIDGVLVPAYTTNSALASIPVIGDIFVGKKGEGIFALSYSVKGPFKSTQVAVNPLSALTPGFLRRVFETQREALPDMKAVDPADAVSETIPAPEEE